MITFRGGQQLANGRRNGLGSGFGGVVAYLMHGRREDLELGADASGRVAWTSTRNLPADDPEDAVWWMRAWANQNPRVKKPVYHFGSSLAPGEHLSQEQWQLVADRMLERLGLEEHQAFLALHQDRDHEHIHIAVNRVGPDGRVWKPSFDALKQQDVARRMERKLGLQVVPTLRDLRLEAKRETAARVDRREAEKPFAKRVALAARDDFRQSGCWDELEARLARHGLRLEPARRGSGVNVTDGHERAGVARIDRNLSGPRLRDRFGDTLREYRKRVPDRPRLERAFERPDVTPDLPIEVRAENLVRHLGAQRATWSEQELRRLTDRDPDGDMLLREALLSDGVVYVGTGARGEERFAVREYIGTEELMFRASDVMAAGGNLQLPRSAVAAILEERFGHLSHEQRNAVLHATTGGDLALIVGRAGSGKTRLARALVAAYHDHGYRVRGSALAGKAAEGLAAEAGIEARTLASYDLAWREGRGTLTSRDVLLVDEAGMVDVRLMARVLHHAKRRGAKVVLIGDQDQLKAIGPGDAFRGLIEQHGAARVDTIRRQAEGWQREASEHLADGRLEPALAAYTERGALQWHSRRDEARDALVMRYFEDRYHVPDQSSLILAYRNADVRRLNDRIREVRRVAGELGEGVRLNGLEFAPGDRVLFLRNDHTGRYVRTVKGDGRGIKNGVLGTLLEVDSHRLRIRLDSGRTVELDPRAYDRLTHGYAATVHKAQGATVDRAYVLADRGFDRNLSYVALTRHRHQLALYVDSESFGSAEHLRRSFAREPRKDLVRDYSPPGAEEVQVRIAAYGGESSAGIAADPQPFEPTFVEATPERLEELQRALSRLDQRDAISDQCRDLIDEKQELPFRGNPWEVKDRIRVRERSRTHRDANLSRIYRKPAAARQALEQLILDHGPVKAYRQLEEAPATLGRLRGHQVLGQQTEARAEALATAHRFGAAGQERYSELAELRTTAEATERYHSQLLDLRRQQDALGERRGDVLDQVRRGAAGLDLNRLEGRLTPAQLKTLRELERADEIHLAPLRRSLVDFRAARHSRKPTETLFSLAYELSGIVKATPRRLIRRLAPPQIKLLLAAVSFAAAVAERLMPELSAREQRRRVLSP